MYRITNKLSNIGVVQCTNKKFLLKSLNRVGEGGKPFTQDQLETYMIKNNICKNPFEINIKNYWKFHKLYNSEFIERVEDFK